MALPYRLEFREAKKLLSIAFPMIVSQASMTIMMFTDRLFLSRISEAHMSAAMIGGLTTFLALTLWLGMVGYVTTLVAQHYGAKKYSDCSLAVSQGVIMSMLALPIIVACIPLGKMLFVASHHDPQQIQLESSYFSLLVLGAPVWLVHTALVGFFVGRGRTSIVMVADVIGMIVNIPFNYILIFGKYGFPALGIEGAAYGSIAGAALTLLILGVVYLKKEHRDQYDVVKNFRFDITMFRKLIRYGFPAGAEMFLTIAAFNIMMQQFHAYGLEVAAAITITMSWDLLAFLPMQGLASAISSMVGRHMGAGNVKEAERFVYRGMAIAFIFDIIMVSFFLFGTKYLVRLFITAEEASAAPFISDLAMTMLRMAGIYVFFESAFLCLAAAMRGAGDTRSVMKITVALHWFFSLGVMAMIHVMHVTPIVAWIGDVLLPVTIALFVFLRFKKGAWKTIRIVEVDAQPTLLAVD